MNVSPHCLDCAEAQARSTNKVTPMDGTIEQKMSGFVLEASLHEAAFKAEKSSNWRVELNAVRDAASMALAERRLCIEGMRYVEKSCSLVQYRRHEAEKS